MSEAGLLADDIWKMLGKRWTVSILQELAFAQVLRFTELKKSLPEISGTMLSERLLQLEFEGLITRKVYSSVPAKVEYGLSASAKELLLLMRQVWDWHARRTSHIRICEILNHPAR
jgi:DNA-binding HxlR family transcriptional regulator